MFIKLQRTVGKKLGRIIGSIFTILLLIVGSFFVFKGFVPQTIRISPTETEVTAYIHKKSFLPPFKDIDIVVPNVKQAIISRGKDSEKKVYCRVELENYDGRKFVVTDKQGYKFKQKLQKQINDSIQSKIPFTVDFIEKDFLFFGILFIVIGVSKILLYFRKIKRLMNMKRAKETFKIPTNITSNNQQQSNDSLQEKYKNINDSIIK